MPLMASIISVISPINSSSVPFIFLSKNYFGLKDTTEVNVSANNQDNTINSDSMTAIKQQIQAENETKQLDYLKDNSN